MNSDTKLKELSLYIAEKSKDDPSFGAIKLNKILFLADFRCYGMTGQAITDTEYVHRENGPAPRRMLVILESIKDEKRGIIVERQYRHYKQKRLMPLTEVSACTFTEEELSFVNEAIDHFKPMDATSASLWTHNLIPWRLTKEGEKIPYYTVFSLNPRPPLEKEAIDWAKAEIARIEGQ